MDKNIPCEKCGVITPQRFRFLLGKPVVWKYGPWAYTYLCDNCYKEYKVYCIKWYKLIFFLCLPIALIITVIAGHFLGAFKH